MPGYNGTGPEGMGPMTGGARGRCNPANGPTGARARPGFVGRPAGAPVYGTGRPRWGLRFGGMGRGRGGGWGRGGGRGRGRGRRW